MHLLRCRRPPLAGFLRHLSWRNDGVSVQRPGLLARRASERHHRQCFIPMGLMPILLDDPGVMRPDLTPVRKQIQGYDRFGKPTCFKVDMFVSQRRPFDQSAMQRAQLAFLGMGHEREESKVSIATTEDIVLARLEWFRWGMKLLRDNGMI